MKKNNTLTLVRSSDQVDFNLIDLLSNGGILKALKEHHVHNTGIII